MKITPVALCLFFLLMLGCKNKQNAGVNTEPSENFRPVSSSGVFPSGNDRGITSSNVSLREEERLAYAGWARVKISDAGAVFVNKRQVSLTDFAAECQRLKQAGRGAVLYIDSPNRPLNPAQKEAFNQLVAAGVGMKLVLKESELD